MQPPNRPPNRQPVDASAVVRLVDEVLASGQVVDRYQIYFLHQMRRNAQYAAEHSTKQFELNQMVYKLLYALTDPYLAGSGTTTEVLLTPRQNAPEAP